MDIYKPPGSIQLNTESYNFQVRLGLQGPGGTGKTWAATTFPNPIFISFDRGLISHIGREDILEVPFYDGKFVDSIVKRAGTLLGPNRKESLIKWLSDNGSKLTINQTLVFDANTGIQAAYHQWWEENKMSFISRTGEVDKFKEWRLKLNFYSELMMLLKEVKCNIIFISHESPDRDSKGELNGGVRPLLTGQFQDELNTHFSDWFRCLVFPKVSPTDAERYKKFKEAFCLDDVTAKEWLASGTKESIFVWQTQSDDKCSCKTSRINCPKYILANYNSFMKYARKISQ